MGRSCASVFVEGKLVGEELSVPTGVQPTNLACAVAVGLALDIEPAVIVDRLRDRRRSTTGSRRWNRRREWPSSMTPTTPTRLGPMPPYGRWFRPLPVGRIRRLARRGWRW